MKKRLFNVLTPLTLLTIALVTTLLFMIDELATQSTRNQNVSEFERPNINEHSPFTSSERLEAIAFKLLQKENPPLQDIQILTEISIKKNPRRFTNYNRLIYIDIAEHGTLTVDGLEALEESLFRSPYGDIASMKWRLEFANAYWEELPDPLQHASLAQITALAESWGQHINWLIQFGTTSRSEIFERIGRATTGSD